MTVYNRTASYGNTEKKIKFNIYAFPTPCQTSEGFKKFSKEFTAWHNDMCSNNNNINIKCNLLSPILPPPLKRSNIREILKNNLDSHDEADNKYKKQQGNNFLSLCEEAQSVNSLCQWKNLCIMYVPSSFFSLWVIPYIGQKNLLEELGCPQRAAKCLKPIFQLGIFLWITN